MSLMTSIVTFWFIHLCLELQPISNQKMGLVGFRHYSFETSGKEIKKIDINKKAQKNFI